MVPDRAAKHVEVTKSGVAGLKKKWVTREAPLPQAKPRPSPADNAQAGIYILLSNHPVNEGCCFCSAYISIKGAPL
jgi:hypothetical protein